MEHTKTVPYLGGEIKFIPAGSYIDEKTKEEKFYDARIKVFPGSRDVVVLSPAAVRALYMVIWSDADLQAFIGV